jgi:iron complex transport system substrate-binding protein
MKGYWLLLVPLLLLACGKPQDRAEGERYVVLSPELAEVISALGAGDRIVGVTEECDYPTELASLARVGKFGSLNREAVLALKPDIVFTTALEQEAISSELRKLGLRVEQFYPRSLEEMLQTVRRVGEVTGRSERAKELTDSLEAFILQMKGEAAGKPRPRVYIEIYRDPLMSVSDASFVGQLIETAGGDNIFSSLERDYARIDAEDVIRAKPEIMICYSRDTLAGILARKGWQDIPALRNGRIYFEEDIDPDLIQRASPRCKEGLLRLREIFAQEAGD